MSKSVSFGPFWLDQVDATLWKGDKQVCLSPKPMAVLQYLVGRPGLLVTKQELLDAVWRQTYVCDGVLKTSISEIRHTLGDSARSPKYISNEPRRGYRFIWPVAIANLPIPLTDFVGRELEVSEVKGLLKRGRLITVSGSAGSGKTRLAIAVASHLLRDFSGGIWWVDVGFLRRPEGLVTAIAACLGATTPGGEDATPVGFVENLIGDRQLLLVLDNCDRVIEACALLVEQLLRQCKKVKVLVTSREPARITGEKPWVLSPLAVPAGDTTQDVLRSEAGVLFVRRATDARPSFELDSDNAPAVAEICRRLDGLPLALELAAARIRVLAPHEIRAHLDDAFGLLGEQSRNEVPRHRTMTAAINWSYELLSDQERTLLGRLSVFAGCFTLAGVQSVCAYDGSISRLETLNLLTSLVDRSLVSVVTPSSVQQTQYRLLEIVRQYAHATLDAESARALHRRHVEFFLYLADTPKANPHGYIVSRFENLALLFRERNNLRAALEWTTADGGDPELGLRLAASLYRYWAFSGQWREGLTYVERLAELKPNGDPSTRAAALCGAGVLAWHGRELERARAYVDESLLLWRNLSDAHNTGRALFYLASIVADLGDLSRAQEYAEASIRVLRKDLKHQDLATALLMLGRIARLQERWDVAIAALEESASIHGAIPEDISASFPVQELALVCVGQGDYDRALRYARENLDRLSQLDYDTFVRGFPAMVDAWSIARVLSLIADIFFSQERYRDAARLCGATERIWETANLSGLELRGIRTIPNPYGLGYAEELRAIKRLQRVLGNTTFDSLWDEGRQLSRDAAVRLGRDGQPTSESRQPKSDPAPKNRRHVVS